MIQTLISSGHHYADVQEYRYGEFLAFYHAIGELESEQLKNRALAVRIAKADKKTWDKFWS